MLTFLKRKTKSFILSMALFLAFFKIHFIECSQKRLDSLRLLSQENSEKENQIDLIRDSVLEKTFDKKLNFYLERMIEKKRVMLTRYLVEENDLDDILSKIKCLWVDTETYLVYNLHNLEKIMNNDTDLLIKNDTNANGGEYYFRMCGNTVKTCNNNASQLVYFHQGKENCKRMSGSIDKYNEWSLLDPKDPKSGVNITLSTGDAFGNPAEGNLYSINIKAKCKLDTNTNKTSYFELDASNLTVTKINNSILIDSDEVCPITFIFDIWNTLEQLKVIGKIICIGICVFGIILCFFGNKLITATIFIISTIFSVLISYNIIYNLIGIEGGSIINSFLMLVAIGLGIALGFLITKKKKIWLSFILGILTAIIIDLILFILILGHFNIPSFVLVIFILASITACIFLFYKYLTIIFIIMTAFNGSYLTLRSLSIFIGGFPSEFFLIYLVFVGEYASIFKYLTWKAYLYILFWICIMGLGIFVQNKFRPEKDLFEEENAKDEISLRKQDYDDLDKSENFDVKNKENLI